MKKYVYTPTNKYGKIWCYMVSEMTISGYLWLYVIIWYYTKVVVQHEEPELKDHANAVFMQSMVFNYAHFVAIKLQCRSVYINNKVARSSLNIYNENICDIIC